MTEVILENVQTEEEQANKELFTPGTIFLVAAIIVFATVMGVALMRQNAGRPTGHAPDFALDTFDDQRFKLSELQGKVVVLNFWASWCAECAYEADDLQRMWEYYEDTGDVVFVGVAWADNGPRSMEFLERYSITYLNGPDKGTVIGDDYNITGVPETFVIDQRGDIVKTIIGPITPTSRIMTPDELMAIIDDLLAQGGES